MRVRNLNRDCLLVTNGQEATGLLARVRGLIGHSELQEGQGLILHPEWAIHTFFMSFPIDVLFVDRPGRVVHLIENMPPGRFSPLILPAHFVIELPVGTIARTGTAVGDQLEILTCLS